MKYLSLYIVFLFWGFGSTLPSSSILSAVTIVNSTEYDHDAGKLTAANWVQYPFIAQPGNGSYTVKLKVTFHFNIWNNGYYDLFITNSVTNEKYTCGQDRSISRLPAGTYLFRVNHSNSTPLSEDSELSMIISETEDTAGLPPMGGAESMRDHNYIISKTFMDESGMVSQDVLEYFDGLGRPIQSVAKEASPFRSDLITLKEYNSYGQHVHDWLPAVLDNGGTFTNIDKVRAASAYWNMDNMPYSTKAYELSPLQRPVKDIGYGQQWYDQGKATHTEYLVNGYNDPESNINVDKDFGTLDYSDMYRHVFSVPAYTAPNTYFVRAKINFPFNLFTSNHSSTENNIYIKNLKTGENNVIINDSQNITLPAGNYLFKIGYENNTAKSIDIDLIFYIVYTGNQEDLPLASSESSSSIDDISFLRCDHYKSAINSLGALKVGQYQDGQLYVTKLIGEDGQTSYKFEDVKGQTVLTREVDESQFYDTYYVYDDFGNLRYVLPPMIVDKTQDLSDNNEIMKQYAFIYKYDSWNRCIWKKLPGVDPVYYAYDKADQLIFTQDGEQRTKGEWAFSVPDAFGRVILAGICTDTLNISNKVVKGVFDVNGIYKRYAIQVDGISKRFVKTPTILSANYYDNYDFRGMTEIPSSNTEYTPQSDYGTWYGGDYTEANKYKNKGMLTGSLVARLDANGTLGYLYSVMYYDERGRLTQTKSNNHLGGIEEEYMAYNFTGQPVKKLHIHSGNGSSEVSEKYTYTYDHAGRLKETRHRLNDSPHIMATINHYDELGRLESSSRNLYQEKNVNP